MLEAHSDTVDHQGMTIEPFQPNVRDGRLYGRGACDTKGAMAAMLWAIRAVLDADGQLPTDLYFVSTCNEELGATGAQRLVEDGLRVDAAVVGEPTELAVVHATKGAIRFRVETCGVAAHSSCPERGVNAIYQMRRVLQVLEEQVAPSLASKAHPLLGPPTISVGTIQGGSQVNIVPASCRIEIDRRLLPQERPEQVAREIQEPLSALCRTVEGLDLTCRQIEYYPPFEEPRDSALSRLAGQACGEVVGRTEFAVAPWASNAGQFKQAGIASVVVGPGSIRQAHTREEFVELDQVVAASAVYAKIVRSFGAEGRVRPPGQRA